MSKKGRNRFLGFIVFLLLVTGGGAYVWFKYFATEVHLKNQNYIFLFVKSDYKLEDIADVLEGEQILENKKTFEWLANEMDLEKNIHPGKYRITNGMNMRQIINLIKYSKQEKIKLTFNTQIHNIDELISYLDEKLELSKNEMESYFSNEELLKRDFLLDSKSSLGILTPSSIDVSWSIGSEELIDLLKQKHQKIWNSNRMKQAAKVGFSKAEVIALASIVQSESGIEQEQKKIAGVYINRMKKNMLLQADPTLKFANKYYDAQRVLDIDKEINSPYNTYMYKGLPPGPICIVNQQAIDAVLNYARHDFIFFCAKPQLNGYSDYSRTYTEHQKFANAYQRSLTKKGINR